MKFQILALMLIVSLIAPTFAQETQPNAAVLQQGEPSSDVRPFEMLSIGDSVVWGQGLLEKDKFSFRIKDWLETVMFKGERIVNLQVKAHSGAAITEKPERGFDPSIYYEGEVNLWTPSITRQADNAFDCYKQPTLNKCYQVPTERLSYYKGNPISPENVDLVLVDGGINDMTPIKLFDASFSKKAIKAAAKNYCGSKMTILLKN
jgi:hypothetical protein